MLADYRENAMEITAKSFSTEFDRITSEVSRVLPRGTGLCVRKKLGLIAWKADGQLRFVQLLKFNRIIYQLSTDLAPTQSDLPVRDAVIPGTCPRYIAELSFHYTEAPLIKGFDLVKFIESCFRFPTRSEAIYKWPLFFASGRWKPRRAWTGLAQSAQRKLSAQEQLPKSVQLPKPLAKHKFIPEPRTKKQEHHNDEILNELVERRKRFYSPAARKHYKKLRSAIRKASSANRHSEEQLVRAIVERYPSKAGAQKLEDIDPQFLRWVRTHWNSLERQLKERSRKESLT